jgi:nucleoside phosphorylase
MGTLNASSLATNALRSFPELQHIVMVGIAGGCPNHTRPDEHVRLGDDGIIAHDYVKETIDGRGIRSAPQKPSAALLGVAAHLEAEELMGGKQSLHRQRKHSTTTVTNAHRVHPMFRWRTHCSASETASEARRSATNCFGRDSRCGHAFEERRHKRRFKGSVRCAGRRNGSERRSKCSLAPRQGYFRRQRYL